MHISISNMEYGNLRTKTFLDFAPSDRAMDDIIGGHGEEDKAFFIQHLDEQNNRVSSFMEFTDYTDDKKLIKAIRQEFEKEWESMFNE